MDRATTSEPGGLDRSRILAWDRGRDESRHYAGAGRPRSKPDPGLPPGARWIAPLRRSREASIEAGSSLVTEGAMNRATTPEPGGLDRSRILACHRGRDGSRHYVGAGRPRSKPDPRL